MNSWGFLVGIGSSIAAGILAWGTRSLLAYIKRRRRAQNFPPIQKHQEAWTIDQSKCFAGRSSLVPQVVKRCLGSALSVLVDEPGTGKSALVVAGLVPALEASRNVWPVLVPALSGNWIDGPAEKVLEAVPLDARCLQSTLHVGSMALPTTVERALQALRNVEAVKGRRACLILDQVDDYLFANAKEFQDGGPITGDRLRALNPFWAGVHALIRSEKITCLLVSCTPRPDGFEALLLEESVGDLNKIGCPRLTRTEAGEVVAALTREFPSGGPSQALTDVILDDLTVGEQLVLPKQLKTVLRACWTLGITSVASYRRKGAEGVIFDYLERALADAAAAGPIPKSAVADMLGRMVSGSGVSRLASIADLTISGVEESAQRASLASLCRSEIVVAGDGSWRLYNQYFCKPIVTLKRRYVDIERRVRASSKILSSWDWATLRRGALPPSVLFKAALAKRSGKLEALPQNVVVASMIGLLWNVRVWCFLAVLALSPPIFQYAWLRHLDSQAIEIASALDHDPALLRAEQEHLDLLTTTWLGVQRRTLALFLQPKYSNAVRAHRYFVDRALRKIPADRDESLRQVWQEACGTNTTAEGEPTDNVCIMLGFAMGENPSPAVTAALLVSENLSRNELEELVRRVIDHDRRAVFSLALHNLQQLTDNSNDASGICALLRAMPASDRGAALHEMTGLGGGQHQLAYLSRWRRLVSLLSCTPHSMRIADLITLSRQAADGVSDAKTPQEVRSAALLLTQLPVGLILGRQAERAADILLDRASQSKGTSEALGFLEGLGYLSNHLGESRVDRVVGLASSIVRSTTSRSELERAGQALPYDPVLVAPSRSSEIADALSRRILSSENMPLTTAALKIGAGRDRLFGSAERCRLVGSALARLRRDPNGELVEPIAAVVFGLRTQGCPAQADWDFVYRHLVKRVLKHQAETPAHYWDEHPDWLRAIMEMASLVGEFVSPSAAAAIGRELRAEYKKRPLEKDLIVDMVLTLPPSSSASIAVDAVKPQLTNALYRSSSRESKQLSMFVTRFEPSISRDARREVIKMLVDLAAVAPPAGWNVGALMRGLLWSASEEDRAQVWDLVYPRWTALQSTPASQRIYGYMLATVSHALPSSRIHAVVNELALARRRPGARECAVAAGLVRPSTVAVLRRVLLDTLACDEDEQQLLRAHLSEQGAVLFGTASITVFARPRSDR